MAKMQKKGKAGAAKAYITRTQAVKRLQVSLADFRRLCILKGIFPREPKNRKKANKGSSVPTSFYYTKDIIYLQHEPVLKKFREYKAFSKKLARAIGRREWFNAKSLEDHQPVYTLDHIIKERYPTFVDALRDMDDALCLVTLFSMLPSNDRIKPELIENCARLSAEWQLYVMRTHSLRKVFLSIKGIYFQAEIMGQTVTWLVPYLFKQHIPADVDFRIMLTFLELYQTLLGFTMFKLYTDINLVYPPPLDVSKDAEAAGVGAFSLQESTDQLRIAAEPAIPASKDVSAKDVKRAIRHIHVSEVPVEQEEAPPADPMEVDTDEPFIEQPSKSAPQAPEPSADAPATVSTVDTSLFVPYVIFLSREVTRPVLEFVIRAFGGRVGWSPTLGSGSPYEESDAAITHVVMDRPSIPVGAIRRGRHYVQPQWVIDSVNKGKVCTEGLYALGEVLPPHLSPFVDEDKVREMGGYVPKEPDGAIGEAVGDMSMGEDEEGEEDEEDEEEGREDEEETGPVNASVGQTALPTAHGSAVILPRPALQAAAAAPGDSTLLHAAELEAEAIGVPSGTFKEQLKTATKKVSRTTGNKKVTNEPEEDKSMAKIMMSNKKRKLYEKMKYGNREREQERLTLEKKAAKLSKDKRREVGNQRKG